MAKRVIKPKLNDADFRNNPLVGPDFKVLVRKQTVGLRVDVDGMTVLNEVDMEQERFTKLYHVSEMRKFVSALRPCSKSLFLWLLYEIEPGKDYLWINKARYMEENNVKSHNTFNTAIRELNRYLFTCPTGVKGVYFINQMIFFNGSRVRKYADRLQVYAPNLPENVMTDYTKGKKEKEI